MVALVLIGALILGWNSPRPDGPADWEAKALPRRVDVATGAVYTSLLDHEASDFTLELVVVPLDGPDSGCYDYGLVYRAQDSANCYVFTIEADGYYTAVSYTHLRAHET